VSKAKEGYIYMVVNGACKHKDMAHFKEQMEIYGGKDVCMDYMEVSWVAVSGASQLGPHNSA
jgi:hypothetical protein